jgi:hypothetical protein
MLRVCVFEVSLNLNKFFQKDSNGGKTAMQLGHLGYT